MLKFILAAAVLLFVVVMLWKRFGWGIPSFRNPFGRSAEAPHGAEADDHHDDGHDDAGHDDHGGGMMSGFGFQTLLLVLAILILVVGWKVLVPEPSTKSARLPSTSYASTPSGAAKMTIPEDACEHMPDDAEVVTAPAESCSKTITVPKEYYVCTDPGMASGLIRKKAWSGSTEPSTWPEGSGKFQCFGSSPDAAGGAIPRQVHVWFEKYI